MRREISLWLPQRSKCRKNKLDKTKYLPRIY